MKNIIPYPLRAAKISIDLHPFIFWMPRFRKVGLTELAKQQGGCIWYMRFAFIEIRFSRWL